jgi:hypothetical protein
MTRLGIGGGLVSSSEWRWAIVWLVLGSGQVFGATLSFVLLAETGMTRWSLGAAVGTSLLTTLSLLLFRH